MKVSGRVEKFLDKGQYAFVLVGKASGAAGRAGKPAVNWKKLPLPWFVLDFILVGVLNSTGWLSNILPV